MEWGLACLNVFQLRDLRIYNEKELAQLDLLVKKKLWYYILPFFKILGYWNYFPERFYEWR